MKENRVIRQCLPPFQEFRSSGPYIMKGSKGLGRRYINVMGNWGQHKNKTFLYARYLIAVNIGKVPDKGTDVDHIDGNPLNDRIDNLRLVDHIENIKKGSVSDPRVLALRRTLRMKCPHCDASFIKPRNMTHIGKGKGRLTFCSKVCARHCREVPVDYVQPFEELSTPEISTYSYQEPWEKWSTEATRREPKIASNSSTCMRAHVDHKSTIRIKKARFCRSCKSALGIERNRSVLCSSCAKPPVRLKDDDYCLEIATKAIKGEMSWTAAGKLLSVSDNAVKKLAKRLGLSFTVREYKKSRQSDSN